MIKRVSLEQLRTGMYIQKLECAWLNHPFARNRFKINSLDDICKLRGAGIKGIYIDTEKGLDVEATQITPPASESTQATNLQSVTPTSFAKVTLKDELGRAEGVKKDANRLITDILSRIHIGKQIDTERVSPVVEQMIGSVFRNQDALLSINQIRHVDKYTFEHSVSVSVLLIAFAKSLGLDESTIHEIGIGGMLHDIGKMRVPDKILNKPGRLTQQEFSIMREHVNFSSKLIGDIGSIPKAAFLVAMQHHERIDGSGYPGKLNGDEISLYGKMAAIVDVYDAITSDRVYHKGEPPSQVLRRMIEWSGTHLDKDLIQRFIQCIGIYPVGSLVMLESGRLAIVNASSDQSLLTPEIKVIYDTKKGRYLTPRVIDLANQPKGSQDRIINSVSPEKYKIRLEVFMD